MKNPQDDLNALCTEVARLNAMEQIRGAIYQCARALDRLDRELLQAQFWPDAQVDYGDFYRGPIAGFLDIAMGFQGSMRDTQHMINNILIEIHGERAAAESYVQAHHVTSEGEKLMQLTVGGRYLDRFSQRNGVWRLSLRTEVLDWGRHLPIEERWFETNQELAKGRRDRNDMSYQFLGT